MIPKVVKAFLKLRFKVVVEREVGLHFGKEGSSFS